MADPRYALVVKLLDHFEPGFLFYDEGSGESHRTRPLKRLLARDPGAGEVLEAAGRLARNAIRPRDGEKDEARNPTIVRTPLCAYALRPAYLPRELGGPGVVVCVDACGRPSGLPSPEALIERFGLTPREAEVALLLAVGESDREIGARLRMSPHTARKHCEHIFAKLKIHTRKALALHLMTSAPAGAELT